LVTIVIDGNILNFNDNGFIYTQAFESVSIQAGVTVDSFFDGIHSNSADSYLTNSGTVVAGTAGIYFAGAAYNSSVVNTAHGVIIGGTNGVYMAGGGTQTLLNLGKIFSTGTNGVDIESNAALGRIVNYGVITSDQIGIDFNVNGLIRNFGSILAPQYAISIDASSDNITATIGNASHGAIRGSVDAIFVTQGAFVLNNYGNIMGGVIGSQGAANDTVRNYGVVRGTLYLGGGNDVFRDFGNGHSGEVIGGHGNDRLIGGAHPDILDGGIGIDVLTGGGGADRFIFDTAPDSSQNFDVITDFKESDHDSIRLESGLFPGIPTGPLDAAHFHLGSPVNGISQIDYNRATGALVYDSDGTGNTLPIHFATLSSHPALHAQDLVVVS
jgi:Ca2+-binding RTX toxin-like protein